MRGLRLGAFVLQEPLGRGASADVWSALHDLSGVEVAVKWSRSPGTGTLTEARHLAGFHHSGIVHVYDAGTHEDRPWIALEKARGTLQDLAAPLAWRDLAQHLLAALAHLHGQGWMHCDVKPSNVLIGTAPRTGESEADRAGVRLTDFGLVSSGFASGGTAHWMAPEQARGESVTPASDVYSVGMLLSAVASTADRASMGDWLRSACSPEARSRFPTAAHALAALPDLQTGPVQAVGADQETQPVAFSMSMSMARPARQQRRSALPWPSTPPVVPPRRTPPDLADAGLGLLSDRTPPLIGREEQALRVWKQLREDSLDDAPTRVVSCTPEGQEELTELLCRWVREAGGRVCDEPPPPGDFALVLHAEERTWPPGVAALRLEQGEGDLGLWELSARAQALGFAHEAATQLALRASGSGRRLTRLIRQLHSARLVDATPLGLVLLGEDDGTERGSTMEQVLSRVDEAWAHSNHLAHADGVLELADRGVMEHADPELRHRARLHGLRLSYDSHPKALARAANEADAAEKEASPEVAAMIRFQHVLLGLRARDVDIVRGALAKMTATLDAPGGEEALLGHGFLAFMESEDPTRFLLDVAEGGKRQRSQAMATLADVSMRAGKMDEAVEWATRGLGSATNRHDRLVAYISLSVATRGDAEAQDRWLTAAELDAKGETDRTLLARLALIRAQYHMDREEWLQADHRLARSSELYRRGGADDIFVVLNHGVVGVRRKDLARIAAITPPDWAYRTANAPAYMKPMMLLHSVLAAPPEGLDAALSALEAHGSLPRQAMEVALEAAELLPTKFAERLRAME